MGPNVKILRNASNWQKSRTICEAVFYILSMLYIRFTDNWEEPVPTFRLPRSRRLMLTGFGLWQPGFMTWSATVVRRLFFQAAAIEDIYISHMYIIMQLNLQANQLISLSATLMKSECSQSDCTMYWWSDIRSTLMSLILSNWVWQRTSCWGDLQWSNSHQCALHNQFASCLSGSFFVVVFSCSFNRNYNVCNYYIFILWSLVS